MRLPPSAEWQQNFAYSVLIIKRDQYFDQNGEDQQQSNASYERNAPTCELVKIRTVKLQINCRPSSLFVAIVVCARKLN